MIPGRLLFFTGIPAYMKKENVRLRPLRISDGSLLKSGFNEEQNLRANGLSSPVTTSGSSLIRWVKRTYDLAWCIEIDSIPAGFAGISRLMPGDSAEAGIMLFDGTFRHRGYGRVVFHMVAETLALRAGLRNLSIRVSEHNGTALSFWQKMGFHIVSREGGICSMGIDLSKRFR